MHLLPTWYRNITVCVYIMIIIFSHLHSFREKTHNCLQSTITNTHNTLSPKSFRLSASSTHLWFFLLLYLEFGVSILLVTRISSHHRILLLAFSYQPLTFGLWPLAFSLQLLTFSYRKGSFNNHVDKKRGEGGSQMSTLLHKSY